MCKSIKKKLSQIEIVQCKSIKESELKSFLTEEELKKIDKLTSGLKCKSLQEKIYCILNDVKEVKICPCCNSNELEFKRFFNHYKQFCSNECYNENRRLTAIKLAKEKNDAKLAQTDVYVKCKVCGEAVKAIHAHLKLSKDDIHSGWDLERYQKEFPDSPTMSKETTNKLSINSSGENNGMHSSKQSKEFLKSNSPFSESFYVKRGFSEDEAKEEVKKFAKNALSDRVSAVSLEWFIEKCDGDVELANQMYKERQSTFTLEKCVAKYGEVEGTKRYNERQKKWSIKMDELYKEGKYQKYNNQRFSSLSHELFSSLPQENSNHTNNEYWIHSSPNFYYYDYKLGNKIIEFNGDYWHMNPSKFNKEFYNKSLKMTAQQKWDNDKLKIETAESYGFTVLVIWESEYKEDKEATVNKCIAFLNS